MYGRVGAHAGGRAPDAMAAGRVLRRRRARIALGLVLVGVVPVLVWFVTSGLFIGTWRYDLYTLHALGLVWVVAFGAAAFAYALPVRLPSRGARAGASTSAAALASGEPTRYEAERLKVPALVAPAVGLGLASPLSLHGVVGAFLGEARHFDDWVRVSIVLVGVAHVVFAWALAYQARKMARDPKANVLEGATKTVLLASAAACLPGAAALFVPPVLTFFTGGLLAPVILLWLRGAARREDRPLN